MRADLAERNDAMAYLYAVEHKTLEEIGAQYGITRERVRQVIQAGYYVDAQAIRAERTAARQEERARHREDEFWDNRLALQEPGHRNDRVYTDEDLIEHLRQAAQEYGQTPSSWAWTRDGRAPAAYLIAIRFGSWRAACEAAGLEPNLPVHRAYSTRLTEDEALDYLVTFLYDPTPRGRGGIVEYDRWRKAHAPRALSGSEIRRRFGSWNVGKAMALARIAEREGAR